MKKKNKNKQGRSRNNISHNCDHNCLTLEDDFIFMFCGLIGATLETTLTYEIL